MGDLSTSEEDDLPCLSPIEDSGILCGMAHTTDHISISFQQLLKDKHEEVKLGCIMYSMYDVFNV